MRDSVGQYLHEIGLVPLLAFNWAATGNPFRLTQGMEIEGFLSTPPAREGETRIGYPPGAWKGGTHTTVQGGGLKLRNFPQTFPGNLATLRNSYSDVLLGLGVWGALLALILPVILFFVAQRFFVQGIVVTGVEK